MQDAISPSAQRCLAEYPVSHVVEEPGDWFVAAEIILPVKDIRSENLIVFCCTPGGGCTGKYFDLGEPAVGLSFAQYAARAGFATVVVDNLATGRSTPGGNRWLSPGSVARANAEAFASATRAVRSLVSSSTEVVTVGLGHSMGAMLTLIAHSLMPQHSALACLGFSPAGLPNVLTGYELRVAGAGTVSPEDLKAIALQRFTDDGRPIASRARQGKFPFHLANGDSSGLAAMSAAGTNLLPLPATLSLLPGSIDAVLENIDVPVFLGGGDHEPWHDAAELVPKFIRSKDITFYTLSNSAHNHNIASNRTVLWQRILNWAMTVATGGSSCSSLAT